jgi:methionyl-tRNA formyltransferase
VLELPAHGRLNVHPSLLPRHRGASPIPATILAGDLVAGVSVMRMDAGLDTGPVVASRSWPLTGRETAPELEMRAAHEGAALIAELFEPYLRGERRPVAQDDAAATLTRPLRRTDGWLDPERPAVQLERQVRAYLPWPGSYLETSMGRLAVLGAAIADRRAGDRTGELAEDGYGLALVAIDGRLRLTEVRPAGGRPMSGAAFRRGHPAVAGRLAGNAE